MPPLPSEMLVRTALLETITAAKVPVSHARIAATEDTSTLSAGS
jgi:hypothetical protein